MKKNASRIIAIALVLMMALALIPLGAHAEIPAEGAPAVKLDKPIVDGRPGVISGLTTDMEYASVDTNWAWVAATAGTLSVENSCTVYFRYKGVEDEARKTSITVYNYYTVTPSCGEGGSVSPSEVQTILGSESVSFVFTPNTNYAIQDVLVNGESVGAVNSYTVANPSGATSVRCTFARETVTVTLQPGEASGEASTGSHPKGTDYTVPDCDFTREGYTFSGWVGTDGSSYAPGDTLPLAADFTLTAQWQQNAVAKVLHFNANGGSAGSTPDMTSSTGVFTLPACGFSREGMHFIGWTINAVAESAANLMQPGSSFTLREGLTEGTLYAQWEQDATGGEGSGSSTPAALTGNVSVTGTPNPGEVLTVTLINTNNTGTLSYQWLKDGTPINGETAGTYTVKNSDLQSRIACRVSSSVQTGSLTSTPVTAYPASKGTPSAAPVSSSSAIPEQVVEGQKRYFGSISGTKTAVYDVTPCWNGDPTKPMSAADIAAALAADHYIPFYLDYPSGTGNGGYSFHVYHYGTDGLKPVHAEDTGRNLLVYGKEFSPFLLLALPTGPADDGVLLAGSPVVNGTLYITWGSGVTPQSFQWTRKVGGYTTNIPGATSYTYIVTAADVGAQIACKVTPASGPVITSNYVIPTVGINPECTQGVYNDGATGTGVISNVTPDMEYIREEDYIKNPSTAKWTSVTGNSITGLKKGGLYIVRLKASPSVTASVNVPEYYSVRVYEKVKDTRYVDSNGNSAPRHGKLTPTATIVEKGGKVLTITATPNKNYAVYDIEVNGSSVSWSKVGNDYKVSLPNVDRRTDVDVRFVYTGSSPHTGDDSHITLWAELAALSLLGLGAALVVLKKKSRA